MTWARHLGSDRRRTAKALKLLPVLQEKSCPENGWHLCEDVGRLLWQEKDTRKSRWVVRNPSSNLTGALVRRLCSLSSSEISKRLLAARNDGVSHKCAQRPSLEALARYLLTVKNLSQRDSPEQPLVGEMLFTQYGINQLDNT